MNTFIDNVATLVVEHVLLRDLPNLVFADWDPSNLTDEEFEVLTGEQPEIIEQRTKSKRRLAALEAVIGICKKYERTSQHTPPEVMSNRFDDYGKLDMADEVAPDDRFRTKSTTWLIKP